MINEYKTLKRMNIRSRRKARLAKSPNAANQSNEVTRQNLSKYQLQATRQSEEKCAAQLEERARWAKNLASHEMAAHFFSGMKLFAIVFVLLSLFALPLRDSFANEYLRANEFEKVFVTKNDTLEAIAARYTDNDSSRVKLAAAIAKVNDLNPSRPLPDGWRIAVPLVK